MLLLMCNSDTPGSRTDDIGKDHDLPSNGLKLSYDDCILVRPNYISIVGLCVGRRAETNLL